MLGAAVVPEGDRFLPPPEAALGFSGFVLNARYGLFAPTMRSIARMDVVATRAEQLCTVLKDWSPAEFDRLVADEGEMWGKVIRENNITLSD